MVHIWLSTLSFESDDASGGEDYWTTQGMLRLNYGAVGESCDDIPACRCY